MGCATACERLHIEDRSRSCGQRSPSEGLVWVWTRVAGGAKHDELTICPGAHAAARETRHRYATGERHTKRHTHQSSDSGSAYRCLSLPGLNRKTACTASKKWYRSSNAPATSHTSLARPYPISHMRRTTSRREVNRQSHGERSPGRRAIPSYTVCDSGTGHISPPIHTFTATQYTHHDTHVWSHRLLAPKAPVPNTGQVAMANVSEAAREAAMAASRS